MTEKRCILLLKVSIYYCLVHTHHTSCRKIQILVDYIVAEERLTVEADHGPRTIKLTAHADDGRQDAAYR
jgi:hypothetical protein